MLPEGMAARLVELLLHGLLDDVMMPQLVNFETTSHQQTEMLGNFWYVQWEGISWHSHLNHVTRIQRFPPRPRNGTWIPNC